MLKVLTTAALGAAFGGYLGFVRGWESTPTLILSILLASLVAWFQAARETERGR